MAVDWTKRPLLVEGVSLFGNGKAMYAAPDGDKINARMLLGADGFHFKKSDFEDFSFEKIGLISPDGHHYDISFDDVGTLLINGAKYTVPTNPDDEVIHGNKTYEGKTNLKGGLQLSSLNGTVFNIIVDDEGNLTTEKEVNDATTDANIK